MFVTGFKEIVDSVLNYFERRQQNRIAFVNEASEVLTQAFRRNAPKSKQGSDHAADHIRFFVTETTNKIKGSIQLDPEYKYLMFTVTGTKAHLIKGSPLRYFVPNNPKPQFAMFVRHPGIKPSDWMGKAREEAAPIIDALRVKHGV